MAVACPSVQPKPASWWHLVLGSINLPADGRRVPRHARLVVPAPPPSLLLPLALPQAILGRLEEERQWRRSNLRFLPQLMLALAGAFLAGWQRGASRAPT